MLRFLTEDKLPDYCTAVVGRGGGGGGGCPGEIQFGRKGFIRMEFGLARGHGGRLEVR